MTEMDVFAGMEKAVRTDHRNPMPTRSGGHQLEPISIRMSNYPWEVVEMKSCVCLSFFSEISFG